MEKSPLRHIHTAIDDKYIDHLVDDDTGLLEEDIPTVLEYLFSNYGKIPSEEVKEKEAEVLTLSFNPADPMVLLYRPIEQLQKMAVTAGIPYSQAQLLEFGLTMIRATRDFEKALSEWSTKPLTDKTWANFKAHFKLAQSELKEIRGPTMQQAGYHHANMLAAQLRMDMDNRNNEMLAMVQSQIIVPEEDPEPENPSANIVSQDSVQLEMLKLLRAIQNDLRTPRTQTSSQTANPAQGGQPRRTKPKKTPDDASFPRRDTNKYCWTHGGCNHSSAECSRQAEGHKADATLTTRKGGSNAFYTANE
jgi:hypothetical protein